MSRLIASLNKLQKQLNHPELPLPTCTLAAESVLLPDKCDCIYVRRPQHPVRSKSPMSIPLTFPSSLKRSLMAPSTVSASVKLRSVWGYPAPKLNRISHVIWENYEDEASSKRSFISCSQLQSIPKHKSFAEV